MSDPRTCAHGVYLRMDCPDCDAPSIAQQPHQPDLPALLAECEQAYAKMTPGPWVRTSPYVPFYIPREVGRPAAQIATMLKHEPWRAYDVRAAAKEAGSWERK